MIMAAAIKIFKDLLVAIFSEEFLKWLLFWVVGMIVASTKTTKDDVFLAKVKEVYEQS